MGVIVTYVRQGLFLNTKTHSVERGRHLLGTFTWIDSPQLVVVRVVDSFTHEVRTLTHSAHHIVPQVMSRDDDYRYTK